MDYDIFAWKDPEIFGAMELELERQQNHLE
jgi:hypothetical protein